LTQAHRYAHPAGPTPPHRLTLAAEAQSLSARDPGGNLDRQFPGLLHTSCSAAGRARRADDRTSSTALTTGPRHGKESLLIPQLTTALTLPTSRRALTA